jgi:hypothetical protein
MSRRIIIQIIVFVALYFSGFNTHEYVNNEQNISLIFSLQNVYLFHAVFSLLVCIVFDALSSNEKFFQQLGFIYLGVLILKIVVFSIVFYNPVLSVENLSKTDSAALLIPIAIFLITEVYFVAKILNKK